ncbi:BbrUII/HgiDII family restriction enzyme [Candidatus Poriferisodalis sp.]|uniref:BbrUII/HgiDII family restriction enzyme n=1 Tax=Candidatus Poriferisodalis sp. TaxID=3101277 RepID=UPI003D0F5B0E
MATYEMTVDLAVLEHLGINLYSNIAAVLAEAVANAWDADATSVSVRLDQDNDAIVISDNGVGMTVDDMNDRYLRVGYARREDDEQTGNTTALGRPVMGRKGLGKLSLFSIADTISIQSARDGERHGCLLTSKGIREASKARSQYFPQALPSDEVEIQVGTKIILNDLKSERLGVSAAALRKRLSRRFSILGMAHDFDMVINGKAVTPDDRGDLRATEYIWTIGEFNEDLSRLPYFKNHKQIPTEYVAEDPGWRVEGWIGTARKPADLNVKKIGNLNGVVLFARGRLFHENILESLSDGRLYTKYITGRINADFLDAEGDVDLATSDRQRVQEDDERVIKLKKYLKRILNEVESDWTEWRGAQKLEDIVDKTPAVREWLNTLGRGPRKQAESMIRRVGRTHFDNESDRNELLKHCIYAFERMKLRGLTAELAEGVEDADTLLRLLSDQDSYEAALYYDIVTSRLQAIKGLIDAVDNNLRERALQEYLFNHLWLLDPAWERASGSERMETQLLKERVIVSDLSKKEKLGRVDICYKTIAGKHIIVELKRADRKMKISDLYDQGTTYVDKVTKIARAQGESNPRVEVVFVLGTVLAEESENPDRLRSLLDSIAPGSRVVYYETLIAQAQDAYSEFLGKNREFAVVQAIVDQV